MVLEGLGKSLRNAVARVTGATSVDDQLIKDVVKDLQRALLQADINVQLVLELTKKIETRASQEKPPAGKSPKEHVINIIYQELVNLVKSDEGLRMGQIGR
ncbi:MAG: signal recognition particle receptor subunit alpha, partial [Candidatus Methanomethylophilaceae archaeon]|nr:signal recognition particle receptor subunit alpha [Candidatus Methanomethylophilaceae archaeon]